MEWSVASRFVESFEERENPVAEIEKRTAGDVLVIKLSRPEAGNTLNLQTQRALQETWREFESSDQHQIAVVHGTADVFSIGHDVKELTEGASPVPLEGSLPLGLSKPVIAAVDGPCYGLGFELALSCDLRVASDNALFGLPDLNLQVPSRVASVMLPRMTFIGSSLSTIFAGEVLDAARARSLRIVNEVVTAGEAESSAVKLAAEMVKRIGGAEAFRKPEIYRLSGVPLPYAMSLASQAERMA